MNTWWLLGQICNRCLLVICWLTYFPPPLPIKLSLKWEFLRTSFEYIYIHNLFQSKTCTISICIYYIYVYINIYYRVGYYIIWNWSCIKGVRGVIVKKEVKANPKCLKLWMMDILIIILLKIQSLQNTLHVSKLTSEYNPWHKHKTPKESWDVVFALWQALNHLGSMLFALLNTIPFLLFLLITMKRKCWQRDSGLVIISNLTLV